MLYTQVCELFPNTFTPAQFWEMVLAKKVLRSTIGRESTRSRARGRRYTGETESTNARAGATIPHRDAKHFAVGCVTSFANCPL